MDMEIDKELPETNASVTSVYSGTVVKIGSWNIYNGPQWGKYVLVEHTNGSSTWVTQYGHIEPKAGLVERSSSNPGSSVAAGGEIGKLITLDYTSTGDYPHLHFGIWNGSYNRLIAYDANAHRGITKDCSTTDYFKFVNPLPYLTQGYAIADDSLITNSSYKCSNVLDFYYGTGYRYLDKNLTNSITFPFTLSGAGYRKVYAKYLSASNLTTKARYTLTHSGQTTVTKDINQTTDLKGGWAYLGQIYYDPSKGQLNVKIQNCSPSVGELIIDALLVDK